MARTLSTTFNTGYSLQVELVLEDTNVIAATINMSEQSVDKMTYLGAIPDGVAEGNYKINKKVSGTYIGHDFVWIGATHGVIYKSRKMVNVVQVNGASQTAGDLAALIAALPGDLFDLAGAIDGKTPRETARYVAAVLAGKINGAQTGTEIAVGLDGSTNRVRFTVDPSGNRTAVEYDP